MSKVHYKHIFGPVLSRRLGVSLGIDMVPHKTCNFDCVYCECGPTTIKSTQRKEYVPFEELKQEIENYLKDKPQLDYITLGGSGEPTLNSCIGRLIGFLKKQYPLYKIALLTNSSLLYDSGIRKELIDIDVIAPSLDSCSQELFCRINRSDSKIDFIIQGLIKLREEYQGQIWLEIFIVPGINDTEKELVLMNEVLKKIQPDKVQLNTLDRPGADKNLRPATSDELNKAASYLKSFEVEILARGKQEALRCDGPELGLSVLRENILSSIKRRPYTLQELSLVFNVSGQEITQLMALLIKEDLVEIFNVGDEEFFKGINKGVGSKE